MPAPVQYMRRFFISDYTTGSSLVILDRDESHHLRKVLRLQVGEKVELLDGRGKCYQGTIDNLADRVEVRLERELASPVESLHPLWVCQGDLKGRKMDELVQRCTELGVQRFIPFHASRSQGRVDQKRQQRKRERWLATMKSACKQSGRLTLMEIADECSFEILISREHWQADVEKILFWEEEQEFRLSSLELGRSANPVCLMLGPEGGFTREEVEQARQCGWRTASLGSQILRAETATLAAVSITQHLLGTI